MQQLLQIVRGSQPWKTACSDTEGFADFGAVKPYIGKKADCASTVKLRYNEYKSEVIRLSTKTVQHGNGRIRAGER